MIFAGNPPTPATLLTDPHVAREQLIVVHTPLPLEFLPRRAAHGGECWGGLSTHVVRLVQDDTARPHTVAHTDKGMQILCPRLPPPASPFPCVRANLGSHS